MAVIVPLSVTAWLAWYWEVGNPEREWWYGPFGLRKALVAPFVMVFALVFCYLFPFKVWNKKIEAGKLFAAGCILFCISFASYFFFRLVVTNSRHLRRLRRMMDIDRDLFDIGLAIILLLLPFVICFVYWFMTHKAVKRIRFANTFLFLFPFFAMLIMTLASHLLFSAGEEEMRDPEIAFRNGYHAGWIAFFMGIAGMIIAAQPALPEKTK